MGYFDQLTNIWSLVACSAFGAVLSWTIIGYLPLYRSSLVSSAIVLTNQFIKENVIFDFFFLPWAVAAFIISDILKHV